MTDNLTLQKSSTFLILRNTKYNKNHYNNAKKGLQLECGKIGLSVKCWGIHPTSLLWHQS